MRANPTRLKPTKTTRQLGKSTHQTTLKLTTMSNFNSSDTGTEGIKMGRLALTCGQVTFFTEQRVNSPLLEKDQKLQKRDSEMTKVIRTSRPMQGIQERSKLNQNTNTVRPSSNISTRNVTSINLNPGTTQETRWARKRRKININPCSKLTNFRPTPLIQPKGSGAVPPLPP